MHQRDHTGAWALVISVTVALIIGAARFDTYWTDDMQPPPTSWDPSTWEDRRP